MTRANRILVTDAHSRACLAVARGLHQAGFEVDAAAAERKRPAPAHWSRSVRERHLAPDPLEDPDGFLAAIEHLVGDGRYAALVPCGDASLLAVSRGRDQLTPHLRLGLPPHDTVRRSLDKPALIAAALRSGLRAPETIVCDGRADALSAAHRLGFPVLLKPVQSILEVVGAQRRVGSRLVADERALEEAVTGYGGPCLVQRHESGTVVSFAGVFADGQLLAQASSRYHRTWRPEGGSASFSQTIETPPWLAARVASLLAEIGWDGLFELELMERAEGGYLALDLNPRPYGSLALAIGAGANLPAIWCEHLLGGEPRRTVAESGVFYRCEEADLSYALSQARHGRVVAAARVLRLRRGVVHSHYRPQDPGPLLARAVVLARRERTRAIAALRTPPRMPHAT